MFTSVLAKQGIAMFLALLKSEIKIKDLGKKCFCLSIIEDKNYLSEILKKAKV